MMTVGFNNVGFHAGAEDLRRYMKSGLDGYMLAAHDLGFVAYQLETGGDLMSTVESLSQADTQRIRERLGELELEMHLHHHGPTSCPDVFLFARKEPIYYEFRDYLKAAVTFIHEVGGSVVTFHPPFADNGTNPDEVPIDPETRQRATDVYGELLREVGKLADDLGVKLGIESAVWGPPRGPWTTIFLSPEELDEFVKAPDMPDSVGILAEISHLHHMGFDVPELIRMWSTKVHEIHTSDAVVHHWTDKGHYAEVLVPETHRVVGEGTLDFRDAIQALVDVGFDGWLSLEIFPSHVKSLDDFVSSREILEKIIREVGNSSG